AVGKYAGVAAAPFDPSAHPGRGVSVRIRDPADRHGRESALFEVGWDRADDLFGHAVAWESAVAVDVLGRGRDHVGRIAHDHVEPLVPNRVEPAPETQLQIPNAVQLCIECGEAQSPGTDVC